VAGLILFTVYVREAESGPLHTVQLGAAEVLRPVRGLFSLVASPLTAARQGVERVLDRDEQEELEQKAQKYEEDAAEAARLRQENERLRQLLKGEQTSFEYAPLARVVAPVGGQLTERMLIDVGTNDGVEPEQPVIVGEKILVGRTTSQVTPNTAEVILVTDQNFAAGVRIVPPLAQEETASKGSATPNEETTSGGSTTPEESTAAERTPSGEGLLRSNWEGYLGVDYVDLSAKVEQGDFVVTSGRAGERELLFPPGLLIGTVESVSSQDIEQYKKIVVAPAAKMNDLQEVRVIVDW
jgi:rod shape-determining protein MreC